MIKLKQQSRDREKIYLLYDDCNANATDAIALHIDFNHPLKFRIVIDSSNDIPLSDFISNNVALTSIKNANEYQNESEWQDGVYKFESYILRTNSVNINVQANVNEIPAIGILNDFDNTDKIYIGERYYIIDKTLSSIDNLVLTEPIVEAALTYKIVTDFKVGFFVIAGEIKQKMLDEINKLSNCPACGGKIDKLSNMLVLFNGLYNNVHCLDLDGAEVIFNNLKAIYDECC